MELLLLIVFGPKARAGAEPAGAEPAVLIAAQHGAAQRTSHPECHAANE